MATVLRLRRMGSNKKPFYRVVATDERTGSSGKILENVGWYDPKKESDNCELKLDRVDYWLNNGARQSETVKALIKKAKAAQPAS